MTTETTVDQETVWWKSTWPLDRTDWLQIFGALVLVIAAFTVVGLLLTDVFAPNAVTDLDVEMAESLAEGRTETNNDLAHWGAFVSDTPVKIGGSALLAAAMFYAWRRWHEVVFMGLTLIFEATAYIVTSFIVGRPRPDVERLLESPVDTSWPSGHVAAATVYMALAIIVFWHTRATWARVLAAVVTIAIPVIVGWARLYQGMHFFSDVVAGIILGILSVWIGYKILGDPPGHSLAGPDDSAPRGAYVQ